MDNREYSYKYPHPALTADAVVFGFDGKGLHVLLIERGIEPFKGSWALPGGFMKIDETIEECALRELREETGVTEVFLEQFHVFSSVDRDPRERVVTVAFYALVRKSAYQLIAGDDASRASWFELDELPPLAFDHQEVVALARKHLRDVLRLRPIAFQLLDEEFSMPELQNLYEAINGVEYDRRNFAKKMNSTGYILEESADDDKADIDIKPSLSTLDDVFAERKFESRTDCFPCCDSSMSMHLSDIHVLHKSLSRRLEAESDEAIQFCECKAAPEIAPEPKRASRRMPKLYRFNKKAYDKDSENDSSKNPFNL